MTFKEAVEKLIAEAKKHENESVVLELENLLRYCQCIELPHTSVASADMDLLYKISVAWNDLLAIADRLRFPRAQLIPYNSK